MLVLFHSVVNCVKDLMETKIIANSGRADFFTHLWKPLLLTTIFFGIVFTLLLTIGFPLISKMYDGLASPFLNRLINHHFEYPVSHYYTRSIQVLMSAYVLMALTIVFLKIPLKVISFLKRKYVYVVLALFLCYSAILLFMLWDKDFFKQPISMDDYSIHFVEGQNELQSFKNFGTHWGYDISRNAGRINNGNDNFWSFLFFLTFEWINNPALVFNISVILSFLIPLVLCFLFSINMRFTKVQQILFLTINIVLLTGFKEIKNFLLSGCTGFILSSYFSLYLWSLFICYFDEKKTKFLIVATVIGCFALWVHPLTGLTSITLLFPLVLLSIKGIGKKELLALSLSLLCVLVSNLPWIIHLVSNGHLHESMTASYLQTKPDQLLISLKSNPSFLLLCILFCRYATITVIKRAWGDFRIVLSVLLLSLVAFLGSQIGLGYSEPARYIIPLTLVLSVCVIKLFENFFRNPAYVILLSLIFLFTIKPVFRFRYGYGQCGQDIVSFIKENVPKDTRILVQETIYGHPWFSAHFSNAIPYFSEVEVVANSGHAQELHFPRFIDNTMFGVSLSNVNDSVLFRYFDLYAISHVLIYEDLARDFFSKKKEFESVFRRGQFEILYYTKAKQGFCYNCSAEIKAQSGIITINRAAKSDIILKYHYYPLLKVVPDTIKIVPVKLFEDPVPFIRVVNANDGKITINQ
jgi:hypothetical protein